MELIGRAHAKLLLFGEHVILHGHPALGLTLPWSLDLRLGLRAAPPQVDDTTRLIQRLLAPRGPHLPPPPHAETWLARVTSRVPIGRGFGSSAALCGALARACAAAQHPPVAEATIAHWARRAEHHFHGRASGIDTALALGSGLTQFRPVAGEPPRARRLRAPLPPLVVGSVSRRGQTATLIRRIAEQLRDRPQWTRDQLDDLGRLSVRAADLLAPGVPVEPAALGSLAQRAQAGLRDLGLSTDSLEGVLDAGVAAGATGGKLSGAGGGGAFYLVCPSEDTAERVRADLAARLPGVAADLAVYTAANPDAVPCRAR